jgi:ADP-heptose:LPS heptosyltransferase
MGDTICYTAVADVLRDALPDAEITWLADSTLAGLIAQHPDVDRVLTVTSPPSRLQSIPTLKTYYRLFTIMRSVRGMKIDYPFDIAIVPRGGIDPSFSAHAVWMLNLPRSAGYSHLVEPDDVDHAFADPLFTDIETRITTLHEATRGIHLLELTGLVPDALERFSTLTTLRVLRAVSAAGNGKEVLQKAGISSDASFIVIAPAASQPRKTWPAHKFHELASRILANTDKLVVLTGTKADVSIAASVAEDLGNRVINTAGKLDLNELITLISQASGFVGNDSGTGHIAGPLGIPVISLHVQAKNSDPYHLNAPEHHRPLGPNVTLLQPERFLAPCTDRCESATVHCLDQITVDEVWIALEAALKAPQSTLAPTRLAHALRIHSTRDL